MYNVKASFLYLLKYKKRDSLLRQTRQHKLHYCILLLTKTRTYHFIERHAEKSQRDVHKIFI